MTTAHYVGIDIGATQIKMGIITSDGRILHKDCIDTAGITGPAQFVSTANDAIRRLMADCSIEQGGIEAIGFGAPGWVDYTAGIVHELTNIPNWEDFPLAREIENATGVKSFVDNDANVMAVGEMIHGAGRGHRNFVCITLGTGVGGAIVIDGKVYRGARGLAGEIGHMTLDMNGPTCACGAAGCLESYVGNHFITARAVELAWEQSAGESKSILVTMADDRPENVTAKMIAEAAWKGDPVSLRVWREVGRRLGTAFAGIINVLNPECFIVGGGVANAGDVLFNQIRDAMQSLAMNKLGYCTPLLKAELGEDAGLIGAATFAMIYSGEGISPPRGN